MRDYVLLYINGQRIIVRGDDVFTPLSTFLRYRQSLTGTKVVCAEGDCGACTVLIGRPNAGKIEFRAVNSCIQYLYQLDGAHIVTVEALAEADSLHPAQQSMVACHGSQCGYCTPGFVMSLASLCEMDEKPSAETVREAVVGNLCRCTGYVPISAAGTSLDPSACKKICQRYHSPGLVEDLTVTMDDPAQVAHGKKLWFKPVTIAQALEFRASHPGATLLAGNTDLGVRMNKGHIDPDIIVTLRCVAGLNDVAIKDGRLIAGAGATWSEIENMVRDTLPEFHAILELFGSPQIRAAGTIGGNIANASPIADSLPLLYVMQAELEIASRTSTRRVPIDRFYKGYKILDLKPDEIIVRIHLPLPKLGEILKLYKVSKRRHLDISTFTAAIRMRQSGETIESIRIAYGGVGPVILRLPKTEEFLAGQTFSEPALMQAGELAMQEITPISDVRSSKEYRNLLAENILLKFYYDCCEFQEIEELN